MGSPRQHAPVDFCVFAAPPWRRMSLVLGAGYRRAVAFRTSGDEGKKIDDNTREPSNSSYRTANVEEISKEVLSSYESREDN